MSLLTKLFPFRRKRDVSGRRGVTLVVVLGMLALMAVLMISYLTSASTELAAAKRYSSGLDARSLTDSAVNIVKAQIQDATTQPSLAWASQPGMVRTYDNAGEPVVAYKLYSSDQLRVSGAFNPVLSVAAEVPSNWASDKALYTDLNRPVTVAGVKHYPIIHPAAVATGPGATSAMDGSGKPIEGCYLDTGNSAVTTSSTQTNPVPMPVKWMYVLKNGTVAAMDPATKKVAGAGATLPDGTPNIITGRIAFWTDDESSKVNINTASVGTYWERPVTASENDLNMARSVPVQNEFQRFPGHPAMTSLSVVFPQDPSESYLTYINRIYGMVPRVVEGGSNAATTTTAVKNNAGLALTPDGQRLYASVDDFLFQAAGPGQTGTGARSAHPTLTQSDVEKARFFITTSSRAPEVNLFNKPRVTLWPLQANSADVTTPTASPDRNAMDKLIAFCSTIGSKPYYFQRFNTYTSATQNPKPSSQSPTDDWTKIPRNQELYAYLQKMSGSAIPGLGGRLGGSVSGSKYSLRVRDQILTEMWDYLRSTINTFSSYTTPTYSYTPFSKNGFLPAQGQVVTLQPPNGTRGFGRFTTVQQVAICFYRKDKITMSGPTVPTQVVPSPSPYTLTGDYTKGVNKLTVQEGVPPYTAPMNIGAVLILQPFCPTPGTPPWSPNVRYVIDGGNQLSINGNSLFPSRMVNLVNSIASTINGSPYVGMEENFQYQGGSSSRQPKTLGTTTATSPEAGYYPFFCDFTLAAGLTSMTFSGGEIKVKIYNGNVAPLVDDDLCQTVTFRFPQVTLPVPNTTSAMSYNTTTGITTITHDNDWVDYNERLNYQIKATGRWGYADDGGHQPIRFFRTTDTARSVEARYAGPLKGDLRLIAVLKDVPAEYFEGHGEKDSPSSDGKKYTNTDVASRLMHSVRIYFPGSGDTSSQNGYYLGNGAAGDKRGKLVKNAAYRDPNRGNNARNSRVPAIPRGMDEAVMADGITLGDWDNGPGTQCDGPYINKGDEGSGNVTQSGNGPYYEMGGYINGAGVVESGASYSPSRQLSSAVTFGSLPSGIDPDDNATTSSPKSKPWQTLLFCKNPAGGQTHPGFGVPLAGPPYDIPPDHAFLDLFTMPIVEPYAISEPFATAGKVNMNYQMVPFTYLTRNTGVRAVLKAVNIQAIPFADADKYKDTAYDPPDYRYSLNLDESKGTLRGFEKRFETGDIFRSASEICDIYLVPDKIITTGLAASGSPTYDTMDAWWKAYSLTGDNTRETPYNSIYPRLTTKSNTFTVHVMTQALKKARNTPVDEWVEGTDTVSGEFRGSVLMERYLDPSSDYLVKSDGRTPANELDDDAMVGPYKWREITVKQFAP